MSTWRKRAGVILQVAFFAAIITLLAVLFKRTLPPTVDLPPIVVPPPDSVAVPVSPLDSLVVRICTEEGFRSHPYPDVHGTTAIGCGTNLNTGGITRPQAEYLVRSTIEERMHSLDTLWPPYSSFPVPWRLALADAAYQLGTAGLLRFTAMRTALAAGDTASANAAIRNSEWYRQTPHRAQRLMQVLAQ